MIGRDREQRMLGEALDRATSERTCLLFTVLGPAGVGKSRLVHEFLADASSRATVLRGRCLSYGEGITFWPLAEAVKQAAGITEEDSTDAARSKLDALTTGTDDGPLVADRVAALVGLAPAGAAGDDAFWAVRRLFETLAADRPLIVVFDDIHWAEPTFLDLIEHIADWSREAPILLLCVARPELLELRSAWGGGKMNASSILLEALGPEECAGLIDNLVGGTALPREARGRILDAAEGNPLFVEEMLAMLIDDGLITFADGRWTANEEVARVAVPPTIQLLLAARLDRLDAEERAMVELGSVEGKVFHRGAVAAMAPEHVRPNVRLRLLALTRKELIRPDRATFAGEDAFRFRHLLIRDAAYQGMPKESRARLHEAFAAWLQDAPGERRTEYEDIVGYHLEQAYRYREELGAIDDHARGLATRAAEALAAAGRRAAARHDSPAAANLMMRAGELYPPTHPDRLRVLIDGTGELVEAGRFQDAYQLASRLKAEAHEADDQGIEARADLDRAFLELTLDPSVAMDRALNEARRVIPVLQEAGDRYGVALARNRQSFYTFVLGRAGEAAVMDREMVEDALASGDVRFMELALAIGGSLFYGPAEAEEALRFVETFVSRLSDHPMLQIDAARELIGLLAMRDRFDEGRELAARYFAANEERGRKWNMAAVGFFAGTLERMAGDLPGAERVFQRSFDLFEQMGDRGFLSTIAGELGEVQWWQGRVEEAERYADISRTNTAEDDVSSLMIWRMVKARVLAHRGEFDVAETLAREAVEIGLRTDYLSQTGDAWFALGEVLRMASKLSEAAAAFGEALALFRRKGNIPQARQAEAEMRASGGSPP
jgi:tetratricopeptide (TPR) repeat protein